MMVMKMKIKDLWSECINALDKNELGSDEYQLKRIESVNKFAVYVGIDSSKNFILAFNVVSRPPSINLKSGAIDYLTIERPDKSWFMVLRLLDAKLFNVFEVLCENLIDAATQCDAEFALILLIEKRLKSWEKLFQAGGNGLLAEFQIQGLLGELIFLQEEIIKSGHEINIPLNAWVGPQGADQDFIFSDHSYEIKTIRVNGETISIASLDQLSSSLPITLVVIELIKVGLGDSQAFNLNEYVTKIENLIYSDPAALMIFRSTLLESGYVRHDYYDKFYFSLNAVTRYQVAEDFPKLTAANVPDAIASCQYTLKLEDLLKFKI
jgi:hypothetical protein